MKKDKSGIKQQQRIRLALRNGRYRVEVRNSWTVVDSPVLVCFYRGAKLIKSFFGTNEEQLIQEANDWLGR